MWHLITRHANTCQAPQLHEFLASLYWFHTVKLVKLNSNSVTYVCTGVFVVQGHQVSEPSFWGGWQSRRIRPVKGLVNFVLFLNVLALLIPYSDLYNSSNVMLSPSIIAESDYIPFKCFVNVFRVIILCLKWYFESWSCWAFHVGGKEHSDLLMHTSLRTSRGWMDTFPDGNCICCQCPSDDMIQNG